MKAQGKKRGMTAQKFMLKASLMYVLVNVNSNHRHQLKMYLMNQFQLVKLL